MDEKEKLLQSLVTGGYLKSSRMVEAFRKIDRADFVPPNEQSHAYENRPLPTAARQTISQPMTVAFMLELLDPRTGEKILDIGAGSGWQTVLLADLVGPDGKVVAVEHIPELCRFAKENIKKYPEQAQRITFICGDATAALPDQQFDKIIAAAAASKEIPIAWRKHLKTGGKIVAPVKNSIWLFIKKAEADWREQEYHGFVFVPLQENTWQPTSPKENSTKKQKFLLFGAVCLVFITLALAYETYLPHARYHGSKTVEIKTGMGPRKIGAYLRDQGVIRSKWVFVTYVSLRGEALLLKPGIYTIGELSIPKISQILIKGGSNERTVVIPEGWSTFDIEDYLRAEHLADSTPFRTSVNGHAAKQFETSFEFLRDKPENLGLEGYLFPDTYRIFVGASSTALVGKMLENFDKKLTPDLRDEIRKQHKTIFEILTVASLIEQEVRTREDRAVVSGILWKRLEVGIPLQVDATLLYAKEVKTGQSSIIISAEDKKIDSPYNTYKYRGLPKGPISNPGINAIRAAIYPKSSPYLYYLSAPDGKTIFSKTLEEHNTAKAKYLR